MKREVLLEIKGIIEEQTQKDAVDFVTRGHLYEKGELLYIVYKESEMMGMKNCTTTLKIEKDKVTMLRYGETNSQMIFEPYIRHANAYDTAFGALMIGVRALSMEVDLSLEEGGFMEISYELDVNNVQTSYNTLSIKVDNLKESFGITGGDIESHTPYMIE